MLTDLNQKSVFMPSPRMISARVQAVFFSASRWLVLILILSVVAKKVFAFEITQMPLSDTLSVEMIVYPSATQRLIIWLPSERGLGAGYRPVAEALADQGITVWALDLHRSYMLPATSDSIDFFDAGILLDVLARAQRLGFTQIALLSSGKGAQLALEMGYRWQQAYPRSDLLTGYIFISPHLFSALPEMGREAEYLPIASSSQLPIYVLHPQYTTKYPRAAEISKVLGGHGAQVFTHPLQGVKGGFHQRPELDLSERDLQIKAQLATIFASAFRLLESVKAPHQTVVVNDVRTLQKQTRRTGQRKLQPYQGHPQPPALNLRTATQQSVDLAALQGKVVLINFWASWCPPCVEEMPSLQRLTEALPEQAFELLSINVGEAAEQVRAFLDEHPVEFPVLLDPDSESVLNWKLYAYPANFLVDKHGQIRYACHGALAWDAPTVIETIQTLIDE